MYELQTNGMSPHHNGRDLQNFEIAVKNGHGGVETKHEECSRTWTCIGDYQVNIQQTIVTLLNNENIVRIYLCKKDRTLL